LKITVDLAIYPLEIVLRACHTFTASYFVRPHIVGNTQVVLDFTPREEGDSLGDLPGAFANALLDARLRATIAEETRTIRELLVAQAFCEADLLDRREIEADEYDDPRGMAQ
jgi:His-Xaa-Ser system protein HxsD